MWTEVPFILRAGLSDGDPPEELKENWPKWMELFDNLKKVYPNLIVDMLAKEKPWCTEETIAEKVSNRPLLGTLC